MAEQKETIILDFQIEQGEAISELEKTKRAIILLKEEQAALNKSYKDGDKSIEEYSKESVKLEQSLKKETTTYNNLNKIVQTTSNSLEAQRLKLSQLTSERNKIDRSTAEGVKRFNELNKSIKELNDTIKESEQAGGDFRRNVGNYSSAVEDFATNVQVGGVSVGDLTGKLTSFLNPATAASGIVAGLGALYTSSAAGARDLESAQTQLATSAKTLANDFAELVGADGKGDGILSRLAFALNSAVFGLTNAVRGQISANAQNTLKELELLDIESKRVAKTALDQSEVARQIRDNDQKTFAERKKAAADVLGFVEVREKVLVNVQEQRLAQLKTLLAFDKNNLELQKEIRQVEFEISDIREDSQGKRTEALNGINALLKEQKTVTQELLELDLQTSQTLDAELTVSYQGATQAIIDRIKALEQSNQLSISAELLNSIEAESIKEKTQADIEYQDQINKSNAAKQKQIDIEQARLALFGQVAQSFVLLAGSSKELALAGVALERASAISQIISNTGIANAKAVAASPLTFGQPFVGINTVSAAISISTILAQAVQSLSDITKAAGGGTFMTKGPQLMLVGDNPGGRERVTVEPISGRGRTVVGDGMIKLAGGGVVETQSATSSARSAFNFANNQKEMKIYTSWTEATQILNKVKFKEKLTTA